MTYDHLMTNEEAIEELKKVDTLDMPARLCEAHYMAIKALEQEPVLDKIRAEVEELPKTYPFINHIDSYVKEDDVKRIIDKYKAESEDKE